MKYLHCNFITEKRYQAFIHIINEHRPLKTPRCPICGYKTNNMEDALNHHSSNHKGTIINDFRIFEKLIIEANIYFYLIEH